MFFAIILMLCLLHLQIFNKYQIIHSLESNFSNLESFKNCFYILAIWFYVGAYNQKIERKSCFNCLSHIVLINSPNADLQGIVYTSTRIIHYENCVHTMWRYRCDRRKWIFRRSKWIWVFFLVFECFFPQYLSLLLHVPLR